MAFKWNWRLTTQLIIEYVSYWQSHSNHYELLGMPHFTTIAVFLTLFKRGGGVEPMLKNCKIGQVGQPLPMTISWTRRVAGGCVFTWAKTQYCQNPPPYHLECNQSWRQPPKKICLYTDWTIFYAFDDFLVFNTRYTIALIFYATLNMIVMAKW